MAAFIRDRLVDAPFGNVVDSVPKEPLADAATLSASLKKKKERSQANMGKTQEVIIGPTREKKGLRRSDRLRSPDGTTFIFITIVVSTAGSKPDPGYLGGHCCEDMGVWSGT